ncbi:nucleotide-binding domain-containing protein [Paenibacillus sp. AGC30]
MYNLDSKFKTFYGTHVILPLIDKNNLYAKKNLNVTRLKDGLVEYNEENGTNYTLAEEPVVQGSVAMSTVIQNDSNEYDIDVALVFEKDDLPSGPIATKNLIVNALKRKTKQFRIEPEAKTNCVRISYADGYHVDFAIYRRYKDNDEDDVYQYEHCGSIWRKRDPRAITQWFNKENKDKDYKIRDIVRLIKMFSKSRLSWANMPGGLIQSVLVVEKFESSERMDERFYKTMIAVRDRLKDNKEVDNPTDPLSSLKLVNKDSIKINNLYNRLNNKISKLDVLFDSNCTWNQAVEAWGEFFNHDYWNGLVKDETVSKSLAAISETVVYFRGVEEYYDFQDSEEFIEDFFPISTQTHYTMELDCKVSKEGQPTTRWLSNILSRHEILLPGHELNFVARTNVPQPYQVYWKVMNKGPFAKRENNIRGQIVRTDKLTHFEVTSFKGDHYVECYIVKNGMCVVKRRVKVPIRV